MAKFAVYHVKSTMLKEYKNRECDAKRLVAKLNAKQSDFERERIGGYGYATVEDYQTKVVYMVTRKNMMSGVEYQEPSNTPGYMSPSSEAYWSM